MSNPDLLQEPLIEHLSSPSEQSLGSEIPSKKRKRNATLEQAGKKSTKKSRSENKKIAGEDELDTEAGLNNAFSHMDNQLLSDYMAQKTRRFEGDLSSVELEDKYISAGSIRDTSSWGKIRTLDNLPGFLEKFSQNPTKLWSASKKNGAPHTIIVAGAGLRAADLARIIRKFQTKDATVAKLFAKHIKMKDAVRFLKNTRTGIAVGTPTRLLDLMEEGALATDKLERIVIDASHIDQKKRGILEMKEMQIPLTRWLVQKDLKDRLGADTNGIDLLFY